MRITIDPQELMNVAALLATSAVELADIGSTLRGCTGCEMPASLRSSVDNVVAMADRLFDDMAVGLRGEAAELVRRAIVAAIDMDLAAGLTIDQIRAQVGLPPIAVAAPVGGSNWGTITSSGTLPSGGGGTYALAGAMQRSQERQQALLAKIKAGGGGNNTSSSSFPMPGSMSISSLPTMFNPWTTMSMSDIRNRVGGSPTAADIKYFNPGLARSRGYT
jgi:hypothetical protein